MAGAFLLLDRSWQQPLGDLKWTGLLQERPAKSFLISLAITVLNYFFNVNETTLIVFSLITLPQSVALGLAANAVTMDLFPTQKFGQFFAAGNIMGMGIKIAGMYAFGLFLDYLHNSYRMTFVWTFFWDSLGFVFLRLHFCEWQRLGGAENYVPPLPSE